MDYALLLVAWSGVAYHSGVQIALLDVLADAAHLVERGAPLTLATALCLGRWAEADALGRGASAGQEQFALVLAALNGQAEAIARLVALGVEASVPCPELYGHATPLHHAVSSGSLDAVRVLVQAGAALDARDAAFQGTPLGWALHYQSQHAHQERASAYAAIADYLRARATPAS